MKKGLLLASLLITGWMISLAPLESSPPAPKPKRINKAIELLEQGQPVYYTQIDGGGYEEGKALAQTWADYITYEMEHGPFSPARLREFMQGLVDGGPTKSGHRTPAVIVTLPVGGLDEYTMRANYWMVEQVLSTGAHGILLCHARSVEAVRFFVQAARYPTQTKAAGDGLGEGLRGNGSQGYPSKIWGISGDEYLDRADPWPLNPDGEILLGLKIEDRYALQNAELTTRVPGIGFAEWGPGDMHMSLGFKRMSRGDVPKVVQEARARVFNACKAAKIAFLNQVTEGGIKATLDEGVMLIAGANAEIADEGRKHSKRQMPW
jgi:4-hydroxy-2-oxoheptanedioate aldolase